MDVEQLGQAVTIALQAGVDPDIKEQAIQFCSLARENPSRWWRAALVIAAPKSSLPTEARFFGYQILDAAIVRMEDGDLQTVKAKIWEYLKLIVSDGAASEPAYLRTQIAKTLTLLFIRLYNVSWPSFFSDLISLYTSCGVSATDLYVRILKVVHEEIGDTLIIRNAETIRRNNMLKDQIRLTDMQTLVGTWISTLNNYDKDYDIVNGMLQVISGWVSWVDISMLLSNRAFIPLLFKNLSREPTRINACDTVREIISKKMPHESKFELMQIMNLIQLLREMPQLSEDIDFDERLAALTSIVAIEIIRIMESGCQSALAAEQLVDQLMPTMVSFLGNEYDDTSLQVVPCINEYLQFVRKECKKLMAGFDTSKLRTDNVGHYIDFPPRRHFIPENRAQNVRMLLHVIMVKSGYSEDSEWVGRVDEDEDNLFLELRAKLKVLQEQVASIDDELFIEEVGQFVTTRLSQSSATWQGTELALFELSVFGETLRSGMARQGKGTESRAQQVLYQLLTAMIESNVIHTDHPSIQLWFMELVYRHSAMFNETNRNLLSNVLRVFASPLGIHNQNVYVRARSWYLFYRFIKAIRKLLTGDEIAAMVLESVSSLLEISVQRPAGDEEESEGKTQIETMFDSQLYLFELCGMILAGSSTGSSLGHNLLLSGFRHLDSALEAAKSPDPVIADVGKLSCHHHLMAIGTLARGMSDAQSVNIETTPLIGDMQLATKAVVTVIESLYSEPLLREASRFAISRLVVLLGPQIIIEISRLINCLLNGSKDEELPDFLSFLGQLVHIFKTDSAVFDMFSSLCNPLFDRIFRALQTTGVDARQGGTDSRNAHSRLIRAYIQFVFNLLNNKYGSVFLVEPNRAIFENVLQSLLHYSISSEIEPPNQKLAVTTLCRMVQLWGKGTVSEDEFGKGQIVPVFSEDDVYTQLMKLCWSILANRQFNLKDAQTRLVVIELGGLQKALLESKKEWYCKLVATYLNNEGMSKLMIDEFVTKLTSLTTKEFKKYFYEFLLRSQ